jgi:hypothetical protein
MMDSTDARSAIEMDTISKSAPRRKYDKQDEQIIRVEHLQREQKRSSFQAEGRRSSREAKINMNSNASEDEDNHLNNIVVVKDLEALQTISND